MEGVINFTKRFNYIQGHNWRRVTLETISDNLYPQLMTSSDVNSYIPFFAGFISEVFKVSDTNNEEDYSFYSIYSLPNPTYVNQRRRSTYADLYLGLRELCTPERFILGGVVYYVMKGCIYIIDALGNPEILMCLGIKPDHIWYIATEGINKINVEENFALFISNSFDNKFFNKLNKEYVSQFKDLGVDVVFTNSVEKRLFKPSYEMPQFNTITESMEYLKGLNRYLYEEA